jgi:hypothetical protein
MEVNSAGHEPAFSFGAMAPNFSLTSVQPHTGALYQCWRLLRQRPPHWGGPIGNRPQVGNLPYL